MKSNHLSFPVYHVDAFTRQLFAGNSAVVCLLPHWLSDQTLQQIAKEHAQPVTVFLVREASAQTFTIRWFTPEDELDLCGHGALSVVTGSSHCLLVPYWSEQLKKTELHALQVSSRGGELFCRNTQGRAWLTSHAVLYFSGQACIEEPILSLQLVPFATRYH